MLPEAVGGRGGRSQINRHNPGYFLLPGDNDCDGLKRTVLNFKKLKFRKGNDFTQDPWLVNGKNQDFNRGL